MKLEYTEYFNELNENKTVDLNNKRLNELLYGLKASIIYEKRLPMTLEHYASVVNQINKSANWNPCSTCSSAVRAVHNQFQIYIWNEIKRINPNLLIEIGQLSSVKFNTYFYRELFKVNALEYCKNCQDDCDIQAANLLKSNNPVNLAMRVNYLDDYKVIQDYIKKRLNYFNEYLPNYLDSLKNNTLTETVQIELIDSDVDNVTNKKKEDKVENRGKGMLKVTKEQVLELLEEGLTNQEVADKLNVSLKTVSRKLKEV